MSIDVSRLSPSDCIGALRSFPRRFRSLLAFAEEDDAADDLLRRPGADGRSALCIVDHVGRSLAYLAETLHRVAVEEQPTLGVGAVEEAERIAARVHRQPSANRELTPGGVLDFVALESDELADWASRRAPHVWARVGLVRGRVHGITALTLLQEAVRTGADGLRDTERALAGGPTSR